MGLALLITAIVLIVCCALVYRFAGRGWTADFIADFALMGIIASGGVLLALLAAIIFA